MTNVATEYNAVNCRVIIFCYNTLMPIDIEKIARLRKEKKLTFAKAAELAGMSGRGNWAAIEHGRRQNLTITTLEEMAKVLGVKARDLLK